MLSALDSGKEVKLFVIRIVGEDLRLVFPEVKQCPLYLVRDTIGFDSSFLIRS